MYVYLPMIDKMYFNRKTLAIWYGTPASESILNCMPLSDLRPGPDRIVRDTDESCGVL
jgi:hypothetical protein